MGNDNELATETPDSASDDVSEQATLPSLAELLSDNAVEQPSDESDGEPKAPVEKKSGLDKATQKLQQRMTTLEEKSSQRLTALEHNQQAALTKMDTILERIESRGGATASDQRQLAQAREQLEELEGDEYEGVTIGQVNKLGKQLNSLLAKNQGEVTPEVTKKIDAIQKQLEEERQSAANERMIAKWDREHPNISGRLDEVWNQACETVMSEEPNLKGDALFGAVSREFKSISRKADAKAKSLKEQLSRHPSRKSPAEAGDADFMKGGAKANTSSAGDDDGIPRYKDGTPKFIRSS